jgi:hypothetical protein
MANTNVIACSITLPYTPIRFLNERVPYRIEGVRGSDLLMLTLRGYAFPQPFCTLLPRNLTEQFRAVEAYNHRRNGEEAPLHLKYYGHQPSIGGGRPIIRISGRKFVHYLA